jgi:tetratricopeptide (TPR) repeat protein
MTNEIVSKILGCGKARKVLGWFASLNRDYVLLALLVSVLVLNNAMWLRIDKHPPAVDGAHYLLKSLEALDAIRKPSPDAIQRLYYQRWGTRPTFAFVAFAIPFYLLFNPTRDVAILGTNTIFYMVIVFATYGLGKLLFDRRVGLLAAFVVSVNPAVSSLSTRYWPHFGVIAIAALGTYLLLRSDNFESKKHMLGFGVLLGIGLLMRPVWPALFLFGPTLFVAVKALFSDVASDANRTMRSFWPELLRSFRSRIIFGLLPGLLIVICLAGPFYLKYHAQIFKLVAHSQEAVVSGERLRQVGRESVLWYFSEMPKDISLFFLVLFVVGVVFALVRYRAKTSLLLFWFATSSILASLPAFKAFFYFAPIYVAVAILSVFWIFHLKNKKIQRMVIGLMLVMGLFTFMVASWNVGPLPEPIMRAMKVRTNPPQPGDWRIEEIIAFLGEQSSSSSPISVGTACFLGNSTEPTFTYYTKLQGLDIRYLRDPLSALLDADYVVARSTRLPGRSSAARKALIVSKVVKRRGSAFHTTHVLIREFSMPDESEAQVYRRVRPASYEETAAIIEQVVDLDPNNVSVHLRLGDAYLSEKELGQAVAVYLRAIEIDPDNVSAHVGLGRAYQAQGELEQAIAAYQEALRLDPLSADIHDRLGRVYRDQGRLEEAVAEYERAIELDPTRAGTYWRLGLSYEGLGRLEEAIVTYEEVLRINPTHEQAQQRLEELASTSVGDFQHPLWRSLGEVIAFLGYNVRPTSVEAGETVQITLWWEAMAQMDEDYTVFVHVVGLDERIWAQQDRLLQHRGYYTTSAWEVGETVREWHELQLPADTPPGEYTVKVGIYYWETGDRLVVWDESGQRVANDTIQLQAVTVIE